MAATVEIDESNGGVEVVTHSITHTTYGSADAVHLVASTSPITAGANAVEKWQRWHLTALGGATSVKTCRYWATVAPTNLNHFFNGHTVQATYDSANHKRTTYAAPASTSTRTPESVPTTEPTSANIGIAGSLTGALTAPGSSDYAVSQVRVNGAATAGGVITVYFSYDEIA